MRIHNGKKPYCCTFPGCFKKFSQSFSFGWSFILRVNDIILHKKLFIIGLVNLTKRINVEYKLIKIKVINSKNNLKIYHNQKLLL